MLSDSARKREKALQGNIKRHGLWLEAWFLSQLSTVLSPCAGEKRFPCWLTAPPSGVVCVHCWAEFALQIYLCVFRLALFA